MFSPFSHVGGKRVIVKQLIEELPQSGITTYVEPFTGGGNLFFNLPEEFLKGLKTRVLNDLDTNIYILLKGFQKFNGETISENINGSYTKEDFLRIKESNPKTFAQKFYKNLLLKRLSILGLGNHFLIRKARDETYNHIKSNMDNRYKDKLKGVKIYNKDYKKIIEEYDSPTTFFYLDPPYEKARGLYKEYKFDPYELLEILKKLKGKFMMSFNYNKEVVDYALESGFSVDKIDVLYISSRKSTGKAKEGREIIIKNY